MVIPATLKESTKKMSFRDSNQIIHGYQCINPADNQTVIDCRIYTGKRSYCSRIIAAVWICDKKGQRFSHGVGFADGHGYHKGSHAIETAIKEMGIKLDEAIGGRGYEACITAFHSIMAALGYSNFVTAEFHA
jgi:hypothetical protein